jgi:hypothetical protein
LPSHAQHRQHLADLKQRREALEAEGLPTGRSFRDQPAWKQANRDKKSTVARLRADLRARWPETVFTVDDRGTYSPFGYNTPFPVWVRWTGGPQESAVEQFAAANVEDGAQQRYRVGYSFYRLDTEEEQAQREQWRAAGRCWRCGSARIETWQEHSRHGLTFNGETRTVEEVRTQRRCLDCGKDHLPAPDAPPAE